MTASDGGRKSLVDTEHGIVAPPSIDCGGMLPRHGTRSLATISRGQSQVKTALCLIFVLILTVFLSLRFSVSLKGSDFPDFYCAARMLADGHGHQLYDADLQRQYQARYAGRVGTLYIHPPPEAALYLVVAWLPLKQAYVLWFWLNIAWLAIATRRLARNALLPWDWGFLLAASLTFVPLLLCLQQGQDSILLLLLVIIAFDAMRRGKTFAAGCWLGLTLFKFQIALPLLFVLVLTCRGKTRNDLVKGFGLAAMGLAIASAGISGWGVFHNYPRFLMYLQAQPFAGIVPEAMANLRGLASLVSGNRHSASLITTVGTFSVAVLGLTIVAWKRSQFAVDSTAAFDWVFSNSVLIALLVSYHLNPHDLSLLLIPLPVLLRQMLAGSPNTVARKWITLSLIGILFLPPLHVWTLLAGNYALIALPILALFLVTSLAPQIKVLVPEGKP